MNISTESQRRKTLLVGDLQNVCDELSEGARIKTLEVNVQNCANRFNDLRPLKSLVDHVDSITVGQFEGPRGASQAAYQHLRDVMRGPVGWTFSSCSDAFKD